MNKIAREYHESQTNILNSQDQPASWGEAFLALGPFLILPFITLLAVILTPLLIRLNMPDLGIGLAFALIGFLLIVLVAGWVKGFPHWSFPYWGFVLLIILYLQNFNGTMFGYPFSGNWWVWIYVVVIVAIGLLWTRNLQSIYRLFSTIWKDWTLLSFTFYGALPLLLIAAYDEVHDSRLVMMLLMLILAVGALLYMRSSKIWQRFACLVAGFSLSWFLAMIHLGLYWNGRQEEWMGEPGSWADTLRWTSGMGAVFTAVFLAPLLIEVLHWVIRWINTPKPE